MTHLQLLSRESKMLALALALLPSTAFATQPLSEFLAQGKARSFDAREQKATAEQRGWESNAALGRLLPSFSARGIYTRNQYEAVVTLPGAPKAITIQPQDGLDAFLQLDVPIIDLASYHRYRQAGHLANAAELQQTLTAYDTDRNVSRAYYSFIGASALVASAEKSLKNAEDNAAYVTTRREVGVAVDLDLERAKANVERAKQDLADARLMTALSARTLETLTGLSPTPATEYPSDDLAPEGDIKGWLDTKETPTDKVQAELDEATTSGKRAAAFALAPTLAVNGQERFTNAAGFVGRSNYYTLQAVLSWRLDYGTYATAQAQAAAGELQKIRVDRVRRSLEDTIFEAYKRVEAGIAKSSAARAQASAARKASELAGERYKAGALTQLDVTQAQKDAFQAEAARIQADTDLAYSRVLLRVTAGKPVASVAAVQRAATVPSAESNIK